MPTVGSHGGDGDWRGGDGRRAPGRAEATEGIRFRVCGRRAGAARAWIRLSGVGVYVGGAGWLSCAPLWAVPLMGRVTNHAVMGHCVCMLS
jgi:hypothetical protein